MIEAAKKVIDKMSYDEVLDYISDLNAGIHQWLAVDREEVLSYAKNKLNNERYYIARIDRKSWSREAVTRQDVEERGFTVKESRRADAAFDVFKDESLVSKLFATKEEAAKWIWDK